MNKKERNKKYQQKWYASNKEKQIARSNEQRKKFVAWFKAYKETLKCEKCNENHPACLDFHHKDPFKKKFIISQFVHSNSKKRLLEEIAKCSVLCANCHRKFHYEEKIKWDNEHSA